MSEDITWETYTPPMDYSPSVVVNDNNFGGIGAVDDWGVYDNPMSVSSSSEWDWGNPQTYTWENATPWQESQGQDMGDWWQDTTKNIVVGGKGDTSDVWSSFDLNAPVEQQDNWWTPWNESKQQNAESWYASPWKIPLETSNAAVLSFPASSMTGSTQTDLSVMSTGPYAVGGAKNLEGTVIPSEGDFIRARSSVQTPVYNWLAEKFPNSPVLGELSWARFAGPGGGVPFPDPSVPVAPGSFEDKVIKPYNELFEVPVNRQQQLSEGSLRFIKEMSNDQYGGYYDKFNNTVALTEDTLSNTFKRIADTVKHEADHFTNLTETPVQNRVAIDKALTGDAWLPNDSFVGLDEKVANRFYGGKIRNGVEAYPRGFESIPYGWGGSVNASPELKTYIGVPEGDPIYSEWKIGADNSNIKGVVQEFVEDPLYKIANSERDAAEISRFNKVLTASDPSYFWGGETALTNQSGESIPSPSNTRITNTSFIPEEGVAYESGATIPRELTYDVDSKLSFNRVNFNTGALNTITGAISILPVALMAYHAENDTRNMDQEQKSNYVYTQGGWMLGLGKPAENTQYHMRKRNNKVGKRVII